MGSDAHEGIKAAVAKVLCASWCVRAYGHPACTTAALTGPASSPPSNPPPAPSSPWSRLLPGLLANDQIPLHIKTCSGDKAAGCVQFVPSAIFTQPAIIDDGDGIGVADRAQAMGDDQHGYATVQAVQGFLNQLFVFVVQVAGGFVQH